MNELKNNAGKTQEEINNKYWDKLTYKASKFYIDKMHELNAKVESGEDGLRRDDSFHGHKAPIHMMYKLETLYNKEESLGYEFLIEYEKEEPTVGIYYGCKCLFPEGVDPQTYINRFNEEWETVKNEILTLLNNTFPSIDFKHRFKWTNNANDGTYWPFWITLNEDEDICGVGLRAIKIIRSVYKRMLENRKYKKFDEPKDKKQKPQTAFTKEAYDELIVNITEKLKDCKYSECYPQVHKLFDEFIDRAINEEIIKKVPWYECAWSFTKSNYEFFLLLKDLLDLIEIKVRGKGNKIGVPWQYIERVFLDKEEMPYKNASLKNAQKDADGKKSVYDIEKWFC